MTTLTDEGALRLRILELALTSNSGDVLSTARLYMDFVRGELQASPAVEAKVTTGAITPGSKRRDDTLSTIRKRMYEIAAEMGVSVQVFLGNSRRRKAVELRHSAIIKINAEHPEFSLSDLGRAFNKDHTTIFHAIRKGGGIPALDAGALQ